MEFFSPLRYPGGKGKISEYIELLFKANSLNGGHYVEPYAGGASVALSLLINERASVIHINDFDYTVYCFWHSVLNQPDELCKLINDTPVNIDVWNLQKEVQKNKNDFDTLDVGFSTFFLNRTNRSGILNAGVIGGLEQKGEWKIDARYNKADLIKRIQRIALYKSRINIYNEDAVKLIPIIINQIPKNSLIYFDPPYYKKGPVLYINFYKHDDHVRIAKTIDKLQHINWIISYDNVEPIKVLYNSYRQRTFDINYHAGSASKGSEVFVYSNNLWMPDIDSPTDKKRIKSYAEQSVLALRESGELSRVLR